MGDLGIGNDEIHRNAECLKKMGASFFFPVSAHEYVQQEGIENVHYFWEGSDDGRIATEEIDLTKNIQGFATVVHFSISIALYMGFREIYLLGCDTTTLLTSFDAVLNESIIKSTHVYRDENTEEYIKRNTCFYGMEHILRQQYECFRDYRLLYDYCNKRNVKLVNLTPKSALDMLPKNLLGNVLNKG